VADRTDLGQFLQARRGRVRQGVLEAIARVLPLDDTERTHLHRLGLAGPRRERSSCPVETPRAGIARLLGSLDGLPAFLLGRRLDLIAWTPLGSMLLGDFAARPADQRNLARLVFLEPAMEELLPDWRSVACETVGLLQLAAGRTPDDPGIAALVEELSLKRESFRSMWSNYDVAEVTSGTRRFRHPDVGELTLSFEALAACDGCEQTLVIHTAEPGSSADTALMLLATCAATDLAARTPKR
jgi:hypothetical protein